MAVAVSSNAGPEGKVCCAQADCVTCPGGKTCTECEASKYLDPTTGTCVTTCPGGYRSTGAPWVAGRECVSCATMHCNDCSTVGTCTECKDSKYLDASGACVDSCPDGYYESGTGVTGRTCVACADASCATCFGAGHGASNATNEAARQIRQVEALLESFDPYMAPPRELEGAARALRRTTILRMRRTKTPKLTHLQVSTSEGSNLSKCKRCLRKSLERIV